VADISNFRCSGKGVDTKFCS